MRCVDGRKERKERRKEEKDFAACTLIFVKVRKPYGLRNLVEKVFLFCFFSFFFFLSFLILFFSVGGKISRIKTGSHMLLFTIGIQHNTSPTATQTGRERERQRVRAKVFL